MTALDTLVQALTDQGHAPRRNGAGWSSRCPAHEDGSPSLSIRGIEGQALVHCFANCATEDVLTALGLTMRDLYDDPRGASYRYDDGRVVHRSPDKQFRQSGTRNGTGVLYRVDRVRAAVAAGQTVFLVEGEKDVHALETLDVVATTSPMGAANWHKVDPKPLAGATVVIVADRDKAGLAYAGQAKADLDALGCRTCVVHTAAGKDAADHVAAGFGVEQFVPLASRGGLTFQSFADLAAEVDAAGPRRWLLRGLWPAGDYGVHAAEAKAQKTWTTADLVVSVASGTPWLGRFDVDDPGPVVMFVGEGGKASTVRRLRAVAAARLIAAEPLPITVCVRAPRLANGAHLAAIADQLDRTRPRLVTIDPLYLSAGGADGKDLYAMGDLLEPVQHIAQEAGTALWVVTHFNRKAGDGAARITGAGPAEWGRVLVTATVKARHNDPTTKATRVLTELSVVGGEIPDQAFRVRRRIWSDDPDNLDLPLHIETTVEQSSDEAPTQETGTLTPAAAKLVEALRASDGEARSSTQLVDWIAEHHGHGLRRETVSRELNSLAEQGLVDYLETGQFSPKLWTIKTSDPGVTSCDVTRDGHTETRRVTRVTSSIDVTRHTSHGHAENLDHADITRETTCVDCGWPTNSTGHATSCGVAS